MQETAMNLFTQTYTKTNHLSGYVQQQGKGLLRQSMARTAGIARSRLNMLRRKG